MKEMYKYGEVIDFIEKKYEIDTRDYRKSHNQFGEWCDAKGYGMKDPEGKDRHSSQIWYAEYTSDIANGRFTERPYEDFWHWVIDMDDEISNGSVGTIYDVSEHINSDGNPQFVKDILKMLVDEGYIENDCFTFWVEW